MKIIVGLGNPGKKHEVDRHNAGFMVLDKLAQKEGLYFNHRPIVHADVASFGEEILLAKPDTFMNDSGVSARQLVRNHEGELVVVYDDIDINLGEVKCSFDRGAGGHNGVQSVIDHLGTKSFYRIRIGVRPVHEELKDKILPPDGFQNFLLKPFAPFESELKEQGIKKAVQIIDVLKTKTFEEVMNEFN
jgi:PTH1 family peptidyl-tRNA hydrolase